MRMAADLGRHPIVTALLEQLDIHQTQEAENFLNPRLSNLTDPFALTQMREAVARVRQAIDKQENVLIFGDYDVDGVTSTTFFTKLLEAFGLKSRYLVPLRLEEGYGLSEAALERAFTEGKPDLVVALDCGTNALPEVSWMRKQGVDVLIIDHHTSKEGTPHDCILVNPHIHDGEDKVWSQLCTIGLVFKFAHALIKQLRDENNITALEFDLRDFLDLVALGTIADLVPLTGENRTLAHAGLRSLKTTIRPGLNALFEISGIDPTADITPYDVSFRIGPRINASGRLGDASMPIELLLSQDVVQCRKHARQLDRFNTERQSIEREISLQAEQQAEVQLSKGNAAVCYAPHWHPGVVGIVASRIMQRYHRPCLVLGADSGMARGSGRSIHGVNLVDALKECDDLLEHWGGHPMAVGVSLPEKHVEALRVRLAQAVDNQLQGDAPDKELTLAAWLPMPDLNERLLHELDALHPFGQGNPEPIFGLKGVRLHEPPRIFGKNHLRFQFPTADGRHIGGVAWKMADRGIPDRHTIDIAFRLQWNHWNGSKCPQMQIVDWREASES